MKPPTCRTTHHWNFRVTSTVVSPRKCTRGSAGKTIRRVNESCQSAASAAPAVARNSVAAGLLGIRQHDPTFDAGAFLQQVQQVCAVVKQAWEDRTLEACRGVMTDPCWQRQKGEMDRGIIDG